MSYYTERHGMRKPIEKTYEIDPGKYAVFLGCCEKYYDNIDWKYPEECEDGRGCCGLDRWKLAEDMKYEIPSLFISDSGEIGVPRVIHNVFKKEPEVDEYDQYALLDFIEFMFENVRDILKGDYHKFFNHYHITTKTTSVIREQFKDEINASFEKTGLLYTLNMNGEVERIVENSVISADILNSVSTIKEQGTKELLQEALALYRSHDSNASRDAVEKLWDAFERLKTYYAQMDKKTSSKTIINDMADGSSDYISLFEEEFQKLTKIGNSFRIRHHETNKIDITDRRYYDYFFNRCLSLIALAVQYLK